MIRLSIIIPFYNMEAYLAKCLDSVLCSKSQEYELILVDNGSEDGSAAIAEQYRARLPERITLIRTENAGPGGGRNAGLPLARGEFLYFLDSDDYLVPGGLDGILSCLEEDFDICLFDSVKVDESGRELSYCAGFTQPGPLTLAEHPELLLQSPNVWDKIFRRSFYLASGVRFPEHLWYEDLRTVLKFYALTDRILYVPKAWHRYLQRSGSITHSRDPKRCLDIIAAVDDLTAFFRERGLGEQYRNELEYLAFYNEFLTSSVRANLADWRSPVQEELLRDFLEKWPDYRGNPYVRKLSTRHKLLAFLLRHRLRLCVHLMMKMNNRLRSRSA